MNDKPRKVYDAPRITARYTWDELVGSLGPAHAIYGDSGVAP